MSSHETHTCPLMSPQCATLPAECPLAEGPLDEAHATADLRPCCVVVVEWPRDSVPQSVWDSPSEGFVIGVLGRDYTLDRGRNLIYHCNHDSLNRDAETWAGVPREGEEVVEGRRVRLRDLAA